MRVKYLITAGLFLLSFPLIGKVSASEISSGVDLYYVGKTIDVGMAKDTWKNVNRKYTFTFYKQ